MAEKEIRSNSEWLLGYEWLLGDELEVEINGVYWNLKISLKKQRLWCP